jgi:hypothetical protein
LSGDRPLELTFSWVNHHHVAGADRPARYRADRHRPASPTRTHRS